VSEGQAILLVVLLVAIAFAAGAGVGYRQGLGDLDHAERTVARLEQLQAKLPKIERLLKGLDQLKQQEAEGDTIMEAIRRVERSRTRRRKPPSTPSRRPDGSWRERDESPIAAAQRRGDQPPPPEERD